MVRVLLAISCIFYQAITDPFGIFCLLLVHRAFDLALSTGYIFAGAYPVFLEVLFCSVLTLHVSLFPGCL